MNCANHPDAEATVRCDGCAEPFCPSCIVEVGGQSYCSACKVITVKNRKRPPTAIKQGKICQESYIALICALAGLLCCCIGIFLHPAALAVAHNALTQIKSSPNLTGTELARSAQAIAIIGLILIFLQTVVGIINIFLSPGDY